MKRTPLNRRTPLRPRTPMRRTGFRRSAAKPAVRNPTRRRPKTPEQRQAWQLARVAVYHRALGRCERCGANLTMTGLEAHHRKLRSRGGGDELSNLAALCPQCHDWVHANPAAAEVSGWMVPTTTDPGSVAVRLWTDQTVRFDDAGGYVDQWAA